MESIAVAKSHGERLLQIHIAGLAALGTLMLGLGQGDLLLPLGVCLAAAVSIWLTDMTGWFRLHRTAANLLALAAVIWVLKDVRQWIGVTQVLFIAKMLVYLQVILLFQKKDARAYWQLGMVSLLQVVVASAFQQGVVFGALLLVYFLLALSAMILFFLYREWDQFDRPEGPPRWIGGVFRWVRRVGQRIGPWGNSRRQPDPSDSADPKSGSLVERRQASAPSRSARVPTPPYPGSDLGDRATPSSRVFGLEKAVDKDVAVVRRRPMTGLSSSLQGGPAPTPSGLGWNLGGQIAKIAVVTWLFTFLLFFVVPRTGGGGWRGAILSLRQSVGFTDQVALGELGRIIQKSDEVLRIRFFDEKGQPYLVNGPLYLRGAVLQHYENGHWRFAPESRFRLIVPLRAYPLPRYRPHILQEITIEPMDRQELFCLWPFATPESDPLLFVDLTQHRLLRARELCEGRFTYTLWTTALEDKGQSALNPARRPDNMHQLLQLPRREGESTIPSLERLAHRWVQELGISAEDRLNAARILESRLRSSPVFKYSLQGQPRNPSLDPVEDFIAEHPQGHCEYFATALALMLRSVGIPSRVVVGYLCDEWNSAGRFYQVRQWHAHMWVEAYLEARHLPSSLTQGEHRGIWSQGGWLRLDPTPLTDPLQDQSVLSRMARSIQGLWDNYVLELDRLRQTEAIYRPILEAVQALLDRVRNPDWWAGVFSGLWEGIGEFFAEWRRSGWFSWRGFVVSFVVGGLLGGIVLGVQKLLRVLRERPSPHSDLPQPPHVIVEFYHRMEVLLRQQGLRRPPGQTPREFALAAGKALADRMHQGLQALAHAASLPEKHSEEQLADSERQLAELPLRVAEAFYQVRFGRQELDAPRTQEVEHTLETLKKLLAGVPPAASGSQLNTCREKIGSLWAPKP